MTLQTCNDLGMTKQESTDKCQECVRIAKIEWGFLYDFDDDAYQRAYRAHSSWEPVEARCGGVSVNGADPKCCEVHMQPWGHKRLHNH